MEYIILFNGAKIGKEFFEIRLRELSQEKWKLKAISELGTDHVDCDLTLSTISPKTCTHYYESDKNSCITMEAYEHYIRKRQ